MGILVQLASIRRTLFNGGERQTYLEELVVGTKMIMDNPGKLSDQVNLVIHFISRLEN